jgi:hypothetical protein
MVRAPTRSPYRPRFLEYDCATMISSPLSTNSRGAKASLSRSPVAKPWGAGGAEAGCQQGCRQRTTGVAAPPPAVGSGVECQWPVGSGGVATDPPWWWWYARERVREGGRR